MSSVQGASRAASEMMPQFIKQTQKASQVAKNVLPESMETASTLASQKVMPPADVKAFKSAYKMPPERNNCVSGMSELACAA